MLAGMNPAQRRIYEEAREQERREKERKAEARQGWKRGGSSVMAAMRLQAGTPVVEPNDADYAKVDSRSFAMM